MGNFILLFITLFVFWAGLVFPLSFQELIVGIILSFSISLLVSIRIKGKEMYKISGIPYVFKFIFIFAWELIKANFSIAKIVLTPSLPISPKIVKVKTSIRSELGKAVLANSITLTPGTLTIDLVGDELYIHVVDGKKVSDADDILLPFEKTLKGALDK
ncbi:Na+/H+ antiporter subunit E [Helicovermis profundi]|uniref:Na+/H+ antiporter subunit E n=1 Tax=Helicovermis profundi TaxID=3065157 RepID=A0AAU9ED55_9FIRM|nr:Na+/H+ antiporter subunit E [Clostridia bacterium S502]